MKKIKLVLAACLALAAIVGIWYAESDAANQAGISVNQETSLLGAVKTATASTSGPGTPSYETRKIRTSNDGHLLTISNAVHKSSYIAATSSYTTTVVDAIYNATFTINGTTFVPNPNILAVANQQKEVFLRNWQFAYAPGDAPMRVRVWDSRGSTANAYLKYDVTFPTTNATTVIDVPFKLYLSSGLNFHKNTATPGVLFWEEFDYEQAFQTGKVQEDLQ